tara:strand:- start:1150 stop:2358 length:1209 start_codon:yes stop_codon:yes gene_type:complete
MVDLKYSIKQNIFAFILSVLQKKKRRAFSYKEFISLFMAASYYLIRNKDPEYNGKFQKKLEKEFQYFLGGGFSKVVNSGTNAVYVALKSIKIRKNSYIAVTPLIDPGVINAILLAGYIPFFIDYDDKYKPVLSRINFLSQNNLDISAIIIVHYYGYVSDISAIKKTCKDRDIKIIEDCSQCHGGCNNGNSIGREGDVSIFSTMSKKSMITGSSGGILFTKNEEIFNLIQSYSDRGKPYGEIYDKNCSNNLFPSLNFNTCDLLCSIGLSSLRRLKKSTSIRRKNSILIQNEINSKKDLFSPKFSDNDCPFIIPLFCLNSHKHLLLNYLRKYNVDFSSEFYQCATKWKWLRNHVDEELIKGCQNAEFFAENHILIYIHEGYNYFYIKSIIEAIRSFRNQIKLKG